MRRIIRVGGIRAEAGYSASNNAEGEINLGKRLKNFDFESEDENEAEIDENEHNADSSPGKDNDDGDGEK